MRNRITNEQIEILRHYYPIGDWDTILKYFPNSKKENIGPLARRHGIRRDNSGSISKKDYTGKKFNLLTALSVDHKKKNMVYWKCKCDCGNETVVSIYSLIKGAVKSCGCLKHRQAINAKDFTGQRFGMLTAIERLPRYNKKETYYRCLCDCGNEKIIKSGNLRSGHTVSCGIHNHKKDDYWKIKHPLNDDKRTYTIYRHVSPNGKSYIGITKQNIERRFQNGNGYNTQPAFWRAIKKYGWESFKHEVLETGLTEKEASQKEEHYIREVFRSTAPNGYNTSEGGSTTVNRSKPVVQFYNDKPVNLFESISEASKLLGIAQFTIRSHSTKEKSVGGYHFVQLKPMFQYEIPVEYCGLKNEKHYNIRDLVAREASKTTIERNIKGSKPVNKYDLNGHYICTFSSLSKAKRSINEFGGEGICAAVNPNRQGDTAYGFLWMYDEGNHNDIKPFQYKNKRKVLQIDANSGKVIKEFDSISKASKALKTSNNMISKACKGEFEKWKGFKWKFK